MTGPTPMGLTTEVHVNVAAIAEIVNDLVTHDRGLRDAVWLRDRAATAGLSAHEYAALEMLRVRVVEQGATLLPKVIQGTWN